MKIHNLTLYQGSQLLIDDANALIQKNFKVGVVGKNGSGKSTLFETILSNHEAQGGEVIWSPDLVVAYIEQTIPSFKESAVYYVMRSRPECHEVYSQILQAEAENQTEKLAFLHNELAELEGYAFKAQAEKVLVGLGFEEEKLYKPIESFSGGWQMRLHLARCLLVKSDLLLLDEPTNHLDLNGILWLQNWLQQFKGTLLLISHDRDFLDDICDHILQLENKKLNLYTGNYSRFIEQRNLALKLQTAQYKKQQEQIKHMMSYVERFQYKASKAKQAQSRLKAIERLDKIDPAVVETSFEFNFQQPEPVGNPLINLHHVAIGFDHKVLLENINLSIQNDSRIGVLGINGAGKSTFLKALMGKLSLLGGEITRNVKLKIGYFSQHQIEQFKAEETPLEVMQRTTPIARESQLRNYLGMFGFSGDKALQNIHKLSGGERARLALAKIIWQRPHLLLLDEPTNHLDLMMREALNIALQKYSGAILLVSHDRFLIRSIADELWLVNNGTVASYQEDLDDYARLINQTFAATPTSDKKASVDIKKKLKEIEKQLEKLTKQSNQLEEEMLKLSQTSPYQEQSKIIALNINKKEIESKINELEALWYQLQE